MAGTPEDYDVDEVVSTADQAIQTALDAIKGAGTKRQTEVRPTPEKRYLLAPVMQEKGSAEMTWAVPELLQGPFKMFEDMYGLLAGGADPTDPEVIKKSLELATSVLGGPVVAKAGGRVVKGARQEAPAPKGDWAKETAESLLEGYEPPLLKGHTPKVYRDEYEIASVPIAREGSLAVSQNMDGEWVLKGPGAIDGSSTHQSINFGDDFAALQAHLTKMGKGATDDADLVPFEWKTPIADMGLMLNKNKDGDWVLTGSGAANGEQSIHQTMNFGKTLDEPLVEQHLAMLEQKLGYSPPGFSEFKSGPHLTAEKKVIVNGKETSWGDFTQASSDYKLMETVEAAYAQGMGKVVYYQEGKQLATMIDLPLAPGMAPKTKSRTEMQNWPDATKVDTIRIDEAHPGPIIAYHGRQSRATGPSGPEHMDIGHTNGLGFHFGTIDQANIFAGGADPRGRLETQVARVIPTFLDVKKPLDVKNFSGWDNPSSLSAALRHEGHEDMAKRIDAIYKAKDAYYETGDRPQREQYERIAAVLEHAGYDSVRYWNTVDAPGWSYVIWKRGQARSATTPDHILYVRGPGPLPKQQGEEDGRLPD